MPTGHASFSGPSASGSSGASAASDTRTTPSRPTNTTRGIWPPTCTRTSSTRVAKRICASNWPPSSVPRPGSPPAPTVFPSKAGSRSPTRASRRFRRPSSLPRKSAADRGADYFRRAPRRRQVGTIPTGEGRARLVGALEERQKRGARIGRRPHLVVRQERKQACALLVDPVRLLGLEVGVPDPGRLRRRVRVKGRLANVLVARPEPERDDFV